MEDCQRELGAEFGERRTSCILFQVFINDEQAFHGENLPLWLPSDRVAFGDTRDEEGKDHEDTRSGYLNAQGL